MGLAPLPLRRESRKKHAIGVARQMGAARVGRGLSCSILSRGLAEFLSNVSVAQIMGKGRLQQRANGSLMSL